MCENKNLVHTTGVTVRMCLIPKTSENLKSLIIFSLNLCISNNVKLFMDTVSVLAYVLYTIVISHHKVWHTVPMARYIV